MREKDRERSVSRYRKRLGQFGYSPKTLGWGEKGNQDVRFFIIGEMILPMPECSVLDVGCGFADLYAYLTHAGWQGRYCGLDINADLLAVAQKRYGDLDLRLMDISDPDATPPGSDFVVSSGMFSAQLLEENHMNYVESTLSRMLEVANLAVCADFLSIHVDFKHPTAWHFAPSDALDMAARITQRFCLRHDYKPYEFSLQLYKNQTISSLNNFEPFERHMDEFDRLHF